MKNYHEEITYLSESFFDELTPEQLENIFGIKLVGLKDDELEANYIQVRNEWNELNWNEVMQIIGDYSIQ